MYLPLDIMLKLPSNALNSISCARGTIPVASMFCTASTAHHTHRRMHVSVFSGTSTEEQHSQAVLSGTRTCATTPHWLHQHNSGLNDRKVRLIMKYISATVDRLGLDQAYNPSPQKQRTKSDVASSLQPSVR